MFTDVSSDLFSYNSSLNVVFVSTAPGECYDAHARRVYVAREVTNVKILKS